MYSVSYPPRQNYFNFFADLLESKIPLGSSVLEIGAGPCLHPALRKLDQHFGRLTGIDPGPEVVDNPHLDKAVQSPFEQWNSDGETFDHAFAFNVLEHLRDPDIFAEKLVSVVRPGGWFWSLAPHSRHPFARLSRIAEVIGLKSIYRGFMQRGDGYHGINDYSSYYRLNSIASVGRYLPPRSDYFDQAEFALLDASWDSYFPSPLKWIPNTFDATVSRALPGFRLIFVFGVRIADRHTLSSNAR